MVLGVAVALKYRTDSSSAPELAKLEWHGGEHVIESHHSSQSHPGPVNVPGAGAGLSSFPSWPSSDVHHNHQRHDQNFNDSNHTPHFYHNSNSEYHQLNHSVPNAGGGAYGFSHPHPPPLSGRRRDNIECAKHAKLYVSPVPRTSTVEDIRPLFVQYGCIVEIVILKDKRTGQQQGSCFVKYATTDDADRAIRALNNQYTFFGEVIPITVKYATDKSIRALNNQHAFLGEVAPITAKYADRERERFAILEKLFVGFLNKDATMKEIEEIFSPYGMVEDIYIVRDEMKQSRGCGFVKFSHKEMALAAMKALNGTYTMRGCDRPLIVRIADPKKPRAGETRVNNILGSTNFGPYMQEPIVRPTTNLGDSVVGHSMPNTSHPVQHFSSSSQPQAVSLLANQEPQTPGVNQQPFPPMPNPPLQLSQMPLHQTQNLQSSQSFQAVSEMQKQLHPIQPSMQSFGQQQWSQVVGQQSPQTGNNPQAFACNSTLAALPVNAQIPELLECDWSEHTCPDGYKYYYNSDTCESRWDKPEEFAIFEQQLKKKIQVQNPCHQLQSPLPVHSTEQVAQTQEVQPQTHVFHQNHEKPPLSASI